MGVMLLVLMPVPYVEASASTVLRSRCRRARGRRGGHGGGAVHRRHGLLLWLLVEPGLTRAVCFNVMLVAGVSTLRLQRQPAAALRRVLHPRRPDRDAQSGAAVGALLGLSGRALPARASQEPSSPRKAAPSAPGSPATASRRRSTACSSRWPSRCSSARSSSSSACCWPCGRWHDGGGADGRAVRHLQARPRCASRAAGHSRRAACSACFGARIFFAPTPFRTQAEGVLWLPEQAMVRAGQAASCGGFVAEPGTQVRAGQALLASYDPSLDAQVRLLEGRVAELEAEYGPSTSPTSRAEIAREQVEAEKLALERRANAPRHYRGGASRRRFHAGRAGDMTGRTTSRARCSATSSARRSRWRASSSCRRWSMPCRVDPPHRGALRR